MTSVISNRTLSRARILANALIRWGTGKASTPPRHVDSILILHELLLGDTLLLGGLFKALRLKWPAAQIYSTCSVPAKSLFSSRPWGVEAIEFDLRVGETVQLLLDKFDEGVDLVILPGHNRYSLLAHACGARWIRALEGDTPRWKNSLCDELLRWPSTPAALSDIFISLAGADGVNEYETGEWPAPDAPNFLGPQGRYAVLHIGAGNPLRYWHNQHWMTVANSIASHGIEPVWSCGPGEIHLVKAADPDGRYSYDYAGKLDLTGMWHFLDRSVATVCLDSGIAHMAKLVGCPTICVFGQGSPALFGKGRYFARQPFVEVATHPMPCRNQHSIFGRNLPWVSRCARRPGECSEPVCILSVAPSTVMEALDALLSQQG